MQLTRHTDYALRLLMYLTDKGDERTSIADVAEAQMISRTHLMKIANELVHRGFLKASRGRGGGISLARAPEDINLGEVVRSTEPNCGLVDCTGCRLARRCNLPSIFDQAENAFHAVLDRYTLAQLVRERRPQPPVAA